ncbi:MAG: transposase, partial [Treponema sp.]|nr:transposase [Treponema sp.]
MGLRTPHCMDAEASEEEAPWGGGPAFRGDIPRIGRAAGKSEIVKGHIRSDHIHMLVEIPPKRGLSTVAGHIKGKGAIAIARA